MTHVIPSTIHMPKVKYINIAKNFSYFPLHMYHEKGKYLHSTSTDNKTIILEKISMVTIISSYKKREIFPEITTTLTIIFCKRHIIFQTNNHHNYMYLKETITLVMTFVHVNSYCLSKISYSNNYFLHTCKNIIFSKGRKPHSSYPCMQIHNLLQNKN